MSFEKKNKSSISSNHRPVRILHVLNKMDRGGAETWLMHILRHIDRERFHLDILVHDSAPGAFDAEAQSLGSRIICCPYSLKYPWQFKRILRDYGPYDIIHSHLHTGGFHLFLASQAGVPVRISHNHSAVTPIWDQISFLKKILIKLSYKLIFRYATGGLAASRLAAAGRFGPNWEADPRSRLLFCGIDLNPFREPVDPQAVRYELGIPDNSLVIGHVGSFSKVKNHISLVKIAHHLSKIEPNFRLLLIGEGTLRPEIESMVDQFGLKDKVIFAGLRADVPRLMLGAMDVFVFPSHFECLPLALLEAQAAGLPCVIPENITAEAQVVKPLFQRLSLAEPALRWAEAVLMAREVKVTRPEALEIMENSLFNIESSCRDLAAVYQDQVSRSRKA